MGLLVVILGAAGCSSLGGRQAANPENEAWFCQSNPAGDGWECVQDAALAQTPVPTRLPPAPQAEEPPPFDIGVPGDLSAGSLPPPIDEVMETDVPLGTPPLAATDFEPVADGARPIQAEASEAPGNSQEPVSAATAPAATTTMVATDAMSTADLDPAGAAPADTARTGSPVTTSSAAGAGKPEVPTHIALAYVPDRPTAMLELPPEYFAVQLLAMASRQAVEDFVNQHGLRGMSAARIEKDNTLYFVLILGVYTSYERAFEASRDLPPPLDTVEPWIRSLGSLQSAMVRADQLAGSSIM